MSVDVLDRISARRPVIDHDGRSGALLERGLLDGATPVYVKTVDVATDIGQLLTGDARRELRLARAGVFDVLPDGVASAVVGVVDHGDRLVTVTRDLGPAVLGWDRRLDRAEVRRVFGAITDVHRAFAGSPPAGLCPLETRLALFAPGQVEQMASANRELAQAVARGQELLSDLVPPDVADALNRAYRHPTLLAEALTADSPMTLLHGDFFLVNVALENHQVVLLDWGLATAGPSAIDLITFCLGATSNVAVDRDTLLADAREACRDLVDDRTFSHCELWGLMELGWNKALDAVDHPNARKRATERADLDFWVGRARAALDAGSPLGTPAANRSTLTPEHCFPLNRRLA